MKLLGEDALAGPGFADEKYRLVSSTRVALELRDATLKVAVRARKNWREVSGGWAAAMGCRMMRVVGGLIVRGCHCWPGGGGVFLADTGSR